eukprot:364439-Chlamydomonas_euryale.AAC.8
MPTLPCAFGAGPRSARPISSAGQESMSCSLLRLVGQAVVGASSPLDAALMLVTMLDGDANVVILRERTRTLRRCSFGHAGAGRGAGPCYHERVVPHPLLACACVACAQNACGRLERMRVPLRDPPPPAVHRSHLIKIYSPVRFVHGCVLRAGGHVVELRVGPLREARLE